MLRRSRDPPVQQNKVHHLCRVGGVRCSGRQVFVVLLLAMLLKGILCPGSGKSFIVTTFPAGHGTPRSCSALPRRHPLSGLSPTRSPPPPPRHRHRRSHLRRSGCWVVVSFEAGWSTGGDDFRAPGTYIEPRGFEICEAAVAASQFPATSRPHPLK